MSFQDNNQDIYAKTHIAPQRTHSNRWSTELRYMDNHDL